MVMGPRLLSKQTRRFVKEYELCQLIGKGSFGEVWICKDRETGKKYAGKLIDKTSLHTFAEREDVQREVAVLEAFQGKHEGVVQLHEVLEGDTVMQLVMELCTGGDLFELLKAKGSLPEEGAKFLLRQLVSGLAFCHSHGVVHRDIKPENILLDTPGNSLYSLKSSSDEAPNVRAKLADFGLAAVLGPDGVTSGYTGSRYYTAPEMLKGWMYGTGADVWSMGVVLCTMLTGRLPFAGTTKQDVDGLRNAIVRGKINFGQPAWAKVSESAKDVVRRMLTVDPNARITAEKLLAHPWLAETVKQEARSVSSRPDGHVSQSLPGSPVAAHQSLQDQRPSASTGPEKVSEFSFHSQKATAAAVVPVEVEGAEAGLGVGGKKGAGPVAGCANGREEEEILRALGLMGGLPLTNVVQESSVKPSAICCVSPLALSTFATAGVWFLPQLLLGGWADHPDVVRKQHSGEPSSPKSVNRSVASSSSSGKDGSACSLKLGEPHKCLAPRQEFYVK